MTAKHTPGPWCAGTYRETPTEDGGEMGVIPIFVGTGPQQIGEVWLLNSDEDETAANAHLFAAAPGMWEFIQKLANAHRDMSQGGWMGLVADEWAEEAAMLLIRIDDTEGKP